MEAAFMSLQEKIVPISQEAERLSDEDAWREIKRVHGMLDSELEKLQIKHEEDIKWTNE